MFRLENKRAAWGLVLSKCIAHFAAGIQRSAVANSRISLRKNSEPIFRLPLSLGLDRE